MFNLVVWRNRKSHKSRSIHEPFTTFFPPLKFLLIGIGRLTRFVVSFSSNFERERERKKFDPSFRGTLLCKCTINQYWTLRKISRFKQFSILFQKIFDRFVSYIEKYAIPSLLHKSSEITNYDSH